MKKSLILIICLGLNLFISLSLFAEASKVAIKTTEEGGYYLTVDNKPFLIKGIIYNPTPICKGYDYEFFTDTNKQWLIDGKLMKDAGINCVRIYSTGEDLDKVKAFINEMYTKFGIYTIVSDWLGLWSYPGVNYADAQFQKNTKERILKITEALKGEKGLLLWVLGNENSYTFSGKICFWTCPEIDKIKELRKQIEKRAQIYYTFVDELAAEIKKIDPNHPVALGNGEESFLDIASKVCDDIDILAIISYRGKKFGNLFNHIKSYFNKPIFISEFGADSYDAYLEKEAEDTQSEYIISQWNNLFEHTVFSKNTQGNCLGGTLFEWSDEWWKHDEGYTPNWCIHNTEAGWSNGSYYFDIKAKNNGLNMNEEWFGIVALSDKKIKATDVDQRIPKKSYYALKDFLNRISRESIKIK
ncbi:MAG: glycosyl hydrolase [Candidatus Omnitrophica bacterium]|jgi:hypothetical protein|nr:glycosyl hydrolase [Candidatus Omnitrophota bacterium]